MPSIVESLYDLTTAIDDTNNDMQQMNNYEQIPFTRNPSYATKQQSTEVDASVTEALDTSAVVDTSPQQVVGNESLDTIVMNTYTPNHSRRIMSLKQHTTRRIVWYALACIAIHN